MPDLAALQTMREALLKARHAGLCTVVHDGKRVSFATDAEMETALLHLERRIAALGTSPIRQVRIATRKGT